MKRIICVVLCLLLSAAVLTGCSAEGKTVLTIGQAEVDSGIFAYYFDGVYAATEAVGGDLLDTGAIVDAAVDKCCEYVGAVTLFSQLNLRLSVDDKKAIADDTEDIWTLYSEYYTAAGISKQTVHKIKQAEYMRKSLLLYYFGEGSEYEVSEEEIEYYFDLTYVEFYAVNGYFTTVDENGNTVGLTEQAKEELRAEFESKRQKVKNGAELSEVNGGNAVEPNFVAVSSTAYPEDFLTKVAGLEYDDPAVIETTEYIFLVVRADAKEGENSSYSSYRTSYIEALRGEMLTDRLVQTGKDYGVERENSRLDRIADSVVDARNERK